MGLWIVRTTSWIPVFLTAPDMKLVKDPDTHAYASPVLSHFLLCGLCPVLTGPCILLCRSSLLQGLAIGKGSQYLLSQEKQKLWLEWRDSHPSAPGISHQNYGPIEMTTYSKNVGSLYCHHVTSSRSCCFQPEGEAEHH